MIPNQLRLCLSRLHWRSFASSAATLAMAMPLLSQSLTIEVGACTVSPSPYGADYRVHVTMPVPEGSDAYGLRLGDWDGSGVVSTQIEVVTRRPDGTPDVVELIGRVTRDSNWPKPLDPDEPMDNREYPVYWTTNSQTPPTPPPGATVGELLSLPDPGDTFAPIVLDPQSLVVVFVDANGNDYAAYPLQGLEGKRVDRYGQHMVTVKTMEILRRVSPWIQNPPEPEMPHAGMGEFYITSVNDDYLLLDLVLSNGLDGFQGSNPLDDKLGKIYLNEAQLLVPGTVNAEQMFRDPLSHQPSPFFAQRHFNGVLHTIIPLVKPMPDGTAHVMGCNSQMVRRLALFPQDSRSATNRAISALRRIGVGFATPGLTTLGGTERWSWWNPLTARYFPQRALLPQFDPADVAQWTVELEDEYEDLAGAFLAGTLHPNTAGLGPSFFGRLGWAHPAGHPNAGGWVVGGHGIFMLEPLRVLATFSHLGFRGLYAEMRAMSDRMPIKLLQIPSETPPLEAGPTDHDKWVHPSGNYTTRTFDVEGIYNVANGYGFCDPVLWEQNRQVAVDMRQPPYEDDLLDFQPHDPAHLVRYSRVTKALAWLANDSVSKDELELSAELFRFTFTPYPGQGWTPAASLFWIEELIADHPGVGVEMFRQHGWMIDALAAAYALGSDAYRARVIDWVDEIVRVLDEGHIACSDPTFTWVNPATSMTEPRPWSFLSATPNPPGYQPNGGDVCSDYFPPGPECPAVRQTFHDLILVWGLRALRECVYDGSAPEDATLRTLIVDATTGFLSPVSMNETDDCIWDYIPIRPRSIDPNYPVVGGPYDEECPPFPQFCSGGQPTAGSYAPKGSCNTDFYYMSAMAYAYAETGDDLYLTATRDRLEHAHGPQSGTLEQQLLTLLSLEFDPSNPGGNAFYRFVNGAMLQALLQ